MGQDNTAPRFYCNDLPYPLVDSSLQIYLDKRQTHHANKVLRLGTGDNVELFNGRGITAQAKLIKYDKKQAVCELSDIEKTNPLSPKLTVASAVPKGSRSDNLIDQLSQIGVDKFIPLRTKRSTVFPRPNKIERYKTIAIEAARQCRRDYLLEIDDMLGFDELLSKVKDNDDSQMPSPDFDIALIGATKNKQPPKDFDNRVKEAKNILIVIGPEGDFTFDELKSAKEAGLESWHFANHILRVGMAAASATAIVRYIASGY